MSLWPFTKVSCQSHEIAPAPKDFPDFAAFKVSTIRLKVWLPEMLMQRIDWISVETDSSRPDVVRGLLFEHLYGKVAYLGLLEYQRLQEHEADRRKADQPVAGQDLSGVEIRRSASRDTPIDLKMLGKSDEDLTLSLSQQFMQDLKTLATEHELTPSSYVRKMLVRHLMGEPLHTQWQQAIGKIPADSLRAEGEH